MIELRQNSKICYHFVKLIIMENSINKILGNTVKKNISSKDFDLAIENLKKVIQIDPKHLVALSTLADLFVFKKKLFRIN